MLFPKMKPTGSQKREKWDQQDETGLQIIMQGEQQY